MKPLVTTVRALRELATGISPDAIWTSPVLYEHAGPSADYIVAAGDSPGDQRVIVTRDNNVKERLVPDELASVRRDALSRMASFAERVRILPWALPRSWHQYRRDNLVAFFAVHRGDTLSTRWIAEVSTGARSDVIFWRVTTSETFVTLEDFAGQERGLSLELESEWSAVFARAREHFDEARRPAASDIDIDLPAVERSPTQGRSYDQWLATVSQDQRKFIEAPTEKAIRLRGPAGSGKTLALTIKAVREVLEARDRRQALRVLIATHSWSLASQIQDSLDTLGLGQIDEIEVFPLLEIAKSLSTAYTYSADSYDIEGDDSQSGTQAQLDEIAGVLADFVEGDWVTYRSTASDGFRARFDSQDGGDRRALAWDLQVEFGSVIGAEGIFPGAGSELRYLQLPRASWMLPLTDGDKTIVFHLYEQYISNLDARSRVTTDQFLADFLSDLQTHRWNRERRRSGYDLIFVDEFHLFSPLERQVLHYLARDVNVYPRVFMAIDPRQSPSAAYIGAIAADETKSSTSVAGDDALGDVTNFELATVHRFTPQILSLVKHVHHEFPTLELGDEWDVDLSAAKSTKADGPVPTLVASASRTGERDELARAVQELYAHGRVALAVVDDRHWNRYSELASLIGRSGKFHVTAISGRSDIEGLGYRNRGLVVGAAEYLAGLQFDHVLVAGIPEILSASPSLNERTRILSLLYLALSRASREVRVFVNDDDGGVPEVLGRAVQLGLARHIKGAGY